MNAKLYIRNIFTGLLLAAAATGPASAWDFDRTRAADIVDRAANSGDETAKLLLGMALDDRVVTNFDNYQFRLPAKTDQGSLHVKRLDPEHVYESLMAGARSSSKESLMAYNLKGTFALRDKNYRMAAVYYQMAERIGDRMLNERGMHPEINALTQDATTGKIAAMRCAGDVPPQKGTYQIDRLLAGFYASDMAKDYRAFIARKTLGHLSTRNLKGSECWDAPLRSATVVLPTAPYNYEINTSKITGVLR